MNAAQRSRISRFAATCRIILAACAGLLAWHGTGRAQELPPARMVDVPGAHLAVRDSGGDGVPLVLLHENTGTSENWSKQWADFTRAGYRVIAFDRRGWGGSTPDPATGPQPGSIARDLDALATQLGLPPFDLVAVAGGGFAALDYLGWHPERVRRAVIGASSGLISDPPFKAFAQRIDIPALTKGAASDLELGASYRGTDPDGVAVWSKIEAHAQQPGARNQPLHTPNTVEKLKGIQTPVLAIVADADLLAPPAFVRMWAEYLPHHELAVIEDSGHSIAWEHPDRFNALVLTFLREP